MWLTNIPQKKGAKCTILALKTRRFSNSSSLLISTSKTTMSERSRFSFGINNRSVRRISAEGKGWVATWRKWSASSRLRVLPKVVIVSTSKIPLCLGSDIWVLNPRAIKKFASRT